jgi:DNA-binding GntR family transcriptional regulator
VSDDSRPALQRIATPELLVAGVVDRLREAILSGRLPAGARLSVPELAAQLGVSRTPVREALFALQRSGLAVMRPRRGAVVFGGGRRELTQLFELREALDGMAARLAAERMSDHERGELVTVASHHDAALDAGDVDTHIALDVELHRVICGGAHNEPLAADLSRLRDQLVLVMRTCSAAPGAMGRGVRRDHHAIVDAVVRGDADAAETAARAHVRNILRFILAAGLGSDDGRPLDDQRSTA